MPSLFHRCNVAQGIVTRRIWPRAEAKGKSTNGPLIWPPLPSPTPLGRKVRQMIGLQPPHPARAPAMHCLGSPLRQQLVALEHVEGYASVAAAPELKKFVAAVKKQGTDDDKTTVFSAPVDVLEAFRDLADTPAFKAFVTTQQARKISQLLLDCDTGECSESDQALVDDNPMLLALQCGAYVNRLYSQLDPNDFDLHD